MSLVEGRTILNDSTGSRIAAPSCESGEFQLRDVITMYLVGTIRETNRSRMSVGLRKRKVVADAAAAERLDGPVDDLTGHVGRDYLDHRNLLLGGLVSRTVHHPRGLQQEKSRLIDEHAG